MTVDRALLFMAAVSFGLGTVGVPASINWVSLGLLCWVATLLLHHA